MFTFRVYPALHIPEKFQKTSDIPWQLFHFRPDVVFLRLLETLPVIQVVFTDTEKKGKKLIPGQPVCPAKAAEIFRGDPGVLQQSAALPVKPQSGQGGGNSERPDHGAVIRVLPDPFRLLRKEIGNRVFSFSPGRPAASPLHHDAPDSEYTPSSLEVHPLLCKYKFKGGGYDDRYHCLFGNRKHA